MNHVLLSGDIASTVRSGITARGNVWARFLLRVPRYKRDEVAPGQAASEQRFEYDYTWVELWGQAARFAFMCLKLQDRVAIAGQLRSYVDKHKLTGPRPARMMAHYVLAHTIEALGRQWNEPLNFSRPPEQLAPKVYAVPAPQNPQSTEKPPDDSLDAAW